MKIQNEQLTALQRQQEAKQKSSIKDTNLFANLLNEKLEEYPKTETANGQIQIPLVNQLTPAGMLLQPNAEVQLMNRLDNLLNQWENYAGQLDSPQKSLRDIYSSFQTLASDLKQTKANVSPETHTILRDVLNEIEVLAETEKIKINRGDYLV